MSQPAIPVRSEEDRYDTEIRVRCYDCEIDDVDKKSGKVYGTRKTAWIWYWQLI